MLNYLAKSVGYGSRSGEGVDESDDEMGEDPTRCPRPKIRQLDGEAKKELSKLLAKEEEKGSQDALFPWFQMIQWVCEKAPDNVVMNWDISKVWCYSHYRCIKSRGLS